MSITEMIAKVGADNLKIQALNTSFVKLSAKKRETELTFATEDALAQSVAREACFGKEGTHLGLVVWIPREKLNP